MEESERASEHVGASDEVLRAGRVGEAEQGVKESEGAAGVETPEGWERFSDDWFVRGRRTGTAHLMVVKPSMVLVVTESWSGNVTIETMFQSLEAAVIWANTRLFGAQQ